MDAAELLAIPTWSAHVLSGVRLGRIGKLRAPSRSMTFNISKGYKLERKEVSDDKFLRSIGLLPNGHRLIEHEFEREATGHWHLLSRDDEASYSVNQEQAGPQ